MEPVSVFDRWCFRPEAWWKGMSLKSAEFQPAGASRQSCLATSHPAASSCAVRHVGIERRRTQRIATRLKKQDQRPSAHAGSQLELEVIDQAAIRAFTPPGKVLRLKSNLLGMLPYHRQAWSAGTPFDGVIAAAPKRTHAERLPARERPLKPP